MVFQPNSCLPRALGSKRGSRSGELGEGATAAPCARVDRRPRAFRLAALLPWSVAPAAKRPSPWVGSAKRHGLWLVPLLCLP
jgi:hypothetical protein